MGDNNENGKFFIAKNRVKKRFTWSFCAEHKFDTVCSCDLTWEIKSQKFKEFPENKRKGTIDRCQYGNTLTDIQMYVKMLVLLDVFFERCGDGFVLRRNKVETDKIWRMLTVVQAGPNWTHIPPLIDGPVCIRSDQVFPCERIVESFICLWDVKNASRPSMSFTDINNDTTVDFFKKHVWQKSTHPEAGSFGFGMTDDFMALPCIPMVNSFRSRSLYNQVFGHKVIDGKVCTYGTLSTSNLDEFKCAAAFDKLRRPISLPNNVTNLLGRYTKSGLRLLYRALGVTDSFGRYSWDWDAGRDSFEYRKGSSPGLRPGNDTIKIEGNVKFIFTHNGSKGIQVPFCLDIIDNAYIEFVQTGRLNLPDTINNVGFKKEMLYSFGETDDALRKQQDKVRLIWLCETMEFVVTSAVQGFRQKFERRGPIKIGMKMTHGGAWRFARSCHYNSKRHFWITGDFSSYDTTLMRFFLNLYAMENLRYYCNKNFGNPTKWKFFMALNKWVARKLGFKIVRKPNGEWGVMDGSMGSGSFCTSHGDSWILAFMFYLWMAYLVDTHPDGELLAKYLDVEDIGIFDFGDDFVIFTLLCMRHMINKDSFKEWVETLGLKFKELEEHLNFLSILNDSCQLVKKGVKFLQVYFVSSEQIPLAEEEEDIDLPDVVPWKDSDRILSRVGFGNGEPKSLIDHAISSIGNVWASFGTNVEVYDFYRDLFSLCCARVGLTGKDWVWNHLNKLGDRKVINSVLRKGDIDIDSLKDGFPTRRRLLEYQIDCADEHMNYHDHEDNGFVTKMVY